MKKRVRVLLASVAVGGTLLLTGTAAHAATPATPGVATGHAASTEHIARPGSEDGNCNCGGSGGRGGGGGGGGNGWGSGGSGCGSNCGGGGGGCGYNCGGGNGYCPPGDQWSSNGGCVPPAKKPCPTPTPTPPCKTSTPPAVSHYSPPPSTPAPAASTSTPPTVVVKVTPTATVTVPPAAVVTATPVPSGPAETGGGLSEGSDSTLAAGGGVAALASSGFGLFAIRRWQQSHRRGGRGRGVRRRGRNTER
jgi:hypothetical protein